MIFATRIVLETKLKNEQPGLRRPRELTRRGRAVVSGAAARDRSAGFSSFVSILNFGLTYALFVVHNWIMKGNK
jgi:hypothetical protein